MDTNRRIATYIEAALKMPNVKEDPCQPLGYDSLYKPLDESQRIYEGGVLALAVVGKIGDAKKAYKLFHRRNAPDAFRCACRLLRITQRLGSKISAAEMYKGFRARTIARKLKLMIIH